MAFYFEGTVHTAGVLKQTVQENICTQKGRSKFVVQKLNI
jgi:hypothetical protein